jgi:arylsulfatase A
MLLSKPHGLRALCALYCFVVTFSACGEAPLSRPNIVLMMADDMGMGDSSAYQDFTGNADDVQLSTPQMERLARMGVRFTDAHTPASRCTPTRYGLLTGRYPWRSRMKWWVLFGAQGDPLIEPDRPTLATMLKGAGYRTAMFGKWHVGLRYRQSDGSPAAGWEDADLTRPLHTSPLDFGFDVARFTSRSHGTSGPDAGSPHRNAAKRNGPQQTIGPGHIHGRLAVGAIGARELVAEGPDAYVLTQLGGRHSDNAIGFLSDHVRDAADKPFFLYYPVNSNHTPYTPDEAIGGRPVAGAARTKSGAAMDARHDFIYENDVALGRLLDWLESTDDPRNEGRKLIENTLVVFTSDNGAEKNSKLATGPFRSHKGSCYEGGHRVPFLVSWPAGGVKGGQSNESPMGLQDLYATFSEIVRRPLPSPRRGEKGAEDSHSVLKAFRGGLIGSRPPMFFNDHKEAKADPAASAMRLDSPEVNGVRFEGKWKIFFDASLLREGVAKPYELYDLATDQGEETNLIDREQLKPLVRFLTGQATLHRNAGGHRLVGELAGSPIRFDWQTQDGDETNLAARFMEKVDQPVAVQSGGVTMTLGASAEVGSVFSVNARGLGISGGNFKQVDSGEALEIRFDRDVVVESVAIVAGNGICGGFYTVGGKAPLAIYCVDADNDAKEQQGVISDVGVLRKGEVLRLDSGRHYGVEPAGQWRLGAITIALLK